MKWIGQDIYDKISRFRNDVYLEGVSESAQDHVVGIDADGKLYKQDVSVGDITGVTAGTNLTGGGTSGAVTINLADASTSVKGAASFSSQNFSVSSGAITIKNEGIDLTAEVTGTLPVTSGGTGLTSLSTLLNSNVDHDALTNFVANEHVDWTTDQGSTNIHTGNVPTLNQNTTGNATTATNLVASTSTAVQLGTIELGHADDTTIARSASGVATIEGKTVVTRDKVIYIETSNFSDDINTDAHYIPFVTTSEHVSFANVAVPFVAPAPGKLLGVHYKANNHTDTSSNTVTFRLDRLDDGLLWSSGNEATIGTKVVDGVNRVNTCSADFTDLTTAGASGTNSFDANEMIGVSLQNSVNFTSTKYSVTIVFEFDFSSYYS